MLMTFPQEVEEQTFWKARACMSMWSAPPGWQGSHTSEIMTVTRRWSGLGLHTPPCMHSVRCSFLPLRIGAKAPHALQRMQLEVQCKTAHRAAILTPDLKALPACRTCMSYDHFDKCCGTGDLRLSWKNLKQPSLSHPTRRHALAQPEQRNCWA